MPGRNRSFSLPRSIDRDDFGFPCPQGGLARALSRHASVVPHAPAPTTVTRVTTRLPSVRAGATKRRPVISPGTTRTQCRLSPEAHGLRSRSRSRRSASPAVARNALPWTKTLQPVWWKGSISIDLEADRPLVEQPELRAEIRAKHDDSRRRRCSSRAPRAPSRPRAQPRRGRHCDARSSLRHSSRGELDRRGPCLAVHGRTTG